MFVILLIIDMLTPSKLSYPLFLSIGNINIAYMASETTILSACIPKLGALRTGLCCGTSSYAVLVC